jgi:TPR repeat protein
MLSAIQRRWSHRAAFALLAVLPLAAPAHPAQPQRRTPERVAHHLLTCRLAARTLLARAPLVRRIDRRIVALLDAKHYRRAATAPPTAARRHADAWAGYTLGGLYANGLGVARNARLAFHWYLWAAKRGNRFAQRQVANAYLNGTGTPRNTAAAAHWFRLGIAPWQLAVTYGELAQTYARAHLVAANRAKVAYYTAKSVADLRALARAPNAQADYYLGLDYALGRGVHRNRTRAAGYLCRAVLLRDTRAAAALVHLHRRSP